MLGTNMASRFRRLREISRSLLRVHSGYYHQHYHNYSVSSLSLHLHTTSSRASERINKRIVESGSHLLRFSTKTELQRESPTENEILSFIKFSLDESEGSNHCWLNTFHGNKGFSEKDGTFLIIAGQFLKMTGSDSILLIEYVKSLQHRFPQLHVVGFQCCSSLSAVEKSDAVQFVMKEYVSFPILLSRKIFEVAKGQCFIIFKDFSNPLFFCEKDMDLSIIERAIEELYEQGNEKSGMPNNGKTTYQKLVETIKEPYLCSFMQNFLLHYPGCISADEQGDRLFLSDCNHHRIIIFNSNGKILDVIGSYPGFEDGEFELAKLARPAASFYHADQNCLYFVDSENRAIRKANLGKRILETIYPENYSSKKSNQLWSWISDKLGLGSPAADRKLEVFNPQSFMFPWHMVQADDGSLLILNRSLQTLWVMDLASGKIIEVVKGRLEIMENYGQSIKEKLSLLQQIPNDWLQQLSDAHIVTGELLFVDLLSSLTPFQNYIFLCDTVGQGVLKYHRKSGESSSLQFSNFGVLGLPCWFDSPLEKVQTIADSFQGGRIDHLQFFRLLPGRVGVQINVDLPADVELVESLQEDSIWRQARGTAAEVSVVEDIAGTSEKVGAAQQWYDELDSLAFSPSESETMAEDNTKASEKIQDGKVQIECAVNTSPGSSEVIIYAALYLRLKRNQDSEENLVKQAARIADILFPGSKMEMRKESCIQFLSKYKRDLRELIFVKPLHVRIRLDSLDHPKADNSKGIILTDSSINVNVSLGS